MTTEADYSLKSLLKPGLFSFSINIFLRLVTLSGKRGKLLTTKSDQHLITPTVSLSNHTFRSREYGNHQKLKKH